MATVFHIAHRHEWEAADLDGQGYCPSPFVDEGFIHCSTPEQVLPSAERHFAGTPDLVLVAMDDERLGPELRYEPAPSVGQDFPHLYRRIQRSDVLAVAAFPRVDGIAYALPDELAER